MSKKIKVCLDAGHVGANYNPSTVVKGYYESEMNWKLHLLLKKELETRGMEVITTRADKNTDLTVYSRGAAAKGCDLFMSLHSNACATESVDYPVVYRAYDNQGNANELGLALAKKIGELMGTKQAGRTATRQNSAGGEYYGVQRGARAVGVPLYYLVEHSFHTNTAATKWLLQDANLQKLAVAEADLIADHFGVTSYPEGKTAIMGSAQATAAQMARFCRSGNPEPKLTGCSLEQLAEMFLEEGKAEGIRGDVAFAQSIVETGFFKYGGIVTPDMNNYAGIGALNGNAQGNAATFPNPRTGVRAQIQHLKAYATTDVAALVNDCVDPRFSLVARGSAPFVEWLGAGDNPNGKGWAVPGKGYGAKIIDILGKILATEAPQELPGATEDNPLDGFPAWQIEGFQALIDGGTINSPEYWTNRFGDPITVGELMGILGKL